MRVLVTGGAGYIGSHVSDLLIQEGHEVVVYDNFSTGFKESIPAACKIVQGDVLETSLLTETLKRNKIEAVIHFAAKLIVPESMEKPLDYYHCNTFGMVSLIQSCQQAQVNKIVFSSTAAVYGDVNSEGLISENANTSPLTPYGRSKLMSETILKDAARAYGIKAVILRYFNVAGADSKGFNGPRDKNATHLFKVASQAALRIRKSVEIFGTDYSTKDGTCIRDFIHVEDLAKIHTLSLDYLSKDHELQIFNCGYGKGFSVKEVLDAMKKVSQNNFPVLEKGRRQGDAECVVADPAKVKQVLGWVPKFDSLEAISASALAWERKMLAEEG
ncbi:MAG TPA: UDP-glucose 4-epimerase GalE [Bdellovibrio sp.]|nr:UDP-glucose 4-epimerase GalE [Bdellovibrio sp.]